MAKKKSSFLVSYAVMVAVAGFAAWVYFAEFKGGEEREKAKSEAAAALPFSADTVTDVSIRADGQEIILKKEGTKGEPVWKVLKPYSDLADKASVDSFLAMVAGEKAAETVVEGADIVWKTYGLDQPAIEATLLSKADVAASTVKREIQIGSVPAFDGSVYVRFDQQPKVVLAASGLKAALQKDPREFRDKRFFPNAVHPDFKEIEIAGAGTPKLHFELKDEVWVEAGGKPSAWPLDQGAVKAYVQTIENLKANEVWAEDKKDSKVLKARKLDHPAIFVRLTPESKKESFYDVKVAALGKDDQVAAAVGSERPLVFSLYKAQIEGLSKASDDFRDLKYPFQFKLADVRAIELERPAGEVSLPLIAKKDGAWIVDPMDPHYQGRSLKTEAVDRLLADVAALQAKKLLPELAPKPKASDKGSLRIGFFGEKNKKLLELVFSPIDEKYRVSSTATPNRVFEIEKAQFESLTLDLLTPVADASGVAPASTPAGTPGVTPEAAKGNP